MYLKNINPYIRVLKCLTITGFYSGFIIGLIPNQITIKKNKRYILPPNNCLPIITGVFGIGIAYMSPLLAFNYFSNGTYLDKKVDEFLSKYDVEIIRYPQKGTTENQYPSLIQINITDKNTSVL